MVSPSWKVLLIGGGTGTGKSTLASQLSQRYETPVLDGDDLRHAVESAVETGSDPNLHIFRDPDFWQLPMTENVARTLAWSKRMCEISETVVARRHFVRRPLIIEAVWLLPEFASQSTFNGVSMEHEVRSLFLHESDKELLRQRLFERDGEDGLPPDQPLRIDDFTEFGRLVTEQARACGIPALQSRPFETLLQRALDVLEN